MVSTTTPTTTITAPSWGAPILLATMAILGLTGAITLGGLVLWTGTVSWAFAALVTAYSTHRTRHTARIIKAFYEQEATN